MKFIVTSTYLLKQLQILGGVINSNNSLAILDNFLFELNKNELKVTASDLENNMSALLEIQSDSVGSIAVPAKLLLEILKTFPEQPLTFSVDEGSTTIEISSESGKYTIAFADGDEYPRAVALEEPSNTKVSAEILSTAISKTIFASGNDELRPVMSGVLFHFSTDGLTFVATDAHKLVKYTRTDVSATEEADFIMPKKPLNILKNILATSNAIVSIDYNNSNATFSFENYTLTCRLIDGKYPNYEAVIPKENPNRLVLDRSMFLNSVRRVAIFANKTTHQIKLKMAGTELNISAEDVDYSNRADERLTCDYQGEDLQIGFNSRFLTEMLTNLTCNDIMLEMSMPNRAGILTSMDGLDEGENILMLVMPVMVNS